MDFFSKTVIAVNFLDKNLNLLKLIHRMDFLVESEIHFVHLVQEINYGDEFSFGVVFPDKEQKNEIREAVISMMKSVSSEILPYSHKGKVVYECQFSSDIKDHFCRYLEKVNADLAIVAPRERKGIFTSSFTNYIGMHSPTSTLILKHHKVSSPEARFKGKMNILVGMKLDHDIETLKNLKKLLFAKNADFTFLHLSNFAQNDLLSKFKLPSHSMDDSLVVIKESIENYIETNKTQFLPVDFNGSFKAECEFSDHPRKSFCERAESMDLVVLVPDKHTPHIGSFIHYQMTHGHSVLLLLRNHH